MVEQIESGKEPRQEEPLREMRLLDHLEELRSTLISSLLSWIVASAAFWFLSRQALDFLMREVPTENLYFLSPAEAFMVRMKLSFVLGFLASFPYIFLRLWKFVSPGLFRRERKVFLPVAISSAALFYGGLAFAYFAMIPLVVAFFLKFGSERLLPLLSVERYFAFVWKLCLAFGVAFQMPVVVLALVSVGLLSARTLLRQWRYVVLIIFIVAAIFTPPDPISQIFMAVPLCVLYLASGVIALTIEKKRKS